MIQTKEEALAFLRSEAEKRGKTLEEFLQTDIRAILEAAWTLQNKLKRPISIDELTEAL